MKDIKEIYENLLKGYKLVNKCGKTIDLEGSNCVDFSCPEDWRIFNPICKKEIANYIVYLDGNIGYYPVHKVTEEQLFGVRFHSKEQAEKASKQMRRANILRYWVSTLQDLDEGNYCITQQLNPNEWVYLLHHKRRDPDKVYMTLETAEKLCDALNSGELVL